MSEHPTLGGRHSSTHWGGARNFCLEGQSYVTNIFIKTPPPPTHTHIYIHTRTFLLYVHIYIHTFLLDKLYIYTYLARKKKV